MAHISVEFRNVLVNKIYRKAMLLSPAARQKSSTGQIITMFSNDTKQIQMFLFFMNNAVVAPFQIIVALALIYQQVGVVMFIGFAFMIILIPLNGFIFVSLNMIRRKKVKETDSRVKLTNEILSGIRVIKFYAWEIAFAEKVAVIRNRELELLKQMAYIVAIGFTLILQAAPIIQPILIFFAYVKLGNTLDAATSFTTISLFNIMQQPFAFLPLGLAQYSQSLVSTKRMLDFFNADELSQYVDREEDQDGKKPDCLHLLLLAISRALCYVGYSITVRYNDSHSHPSNSNSHPRLIYEGTVISMDRVSMCWIQNEPVVNDMKNAEVDKPIEPHDKSEEKDEKDASDAIDLEVVRSKGIRIHSELKKDGTSEETKDEKLYEYDQKENRSANTLLDISFKIKKGTVLPLLRDDNFVYFLQ
jgi:ABC-type multidrug transport system fused ATPase/permease subunit